MFIFCLALFSLYLISVLISYVYLLHITCLPFMFCNLFYVPFLITQSFDRQKKGLTFDATHSKQLTYLTFLPSLVAWCSILHPVVHPATFWQAMSRPRQRVARADEMPGLWPQPYGSVQGARCRRVLWPL